jgi:hypothetical protein
MVCGKVGVEIFHIHYMNQEVQWGDTKIGTLCNSKDSAHIAANFDTLPSARKLLFMHEILDKSYVHNTCTKFQS